jgi:hypothetical protein
MFESVSFSICFSSVSVDFVHKLIEYIMLFGLSTLLVLLFADFVSSSFNYFSCLGYEPWPVDLSPYAIDRDAMIMQDWLYARQHSRWRCSTYGNDAFSAAYGIGNGFLKAAVIMERTVRSGQIFRPTIPYQWANGAKNCTYDSNYFDCYFKELSGCGLNSSNLHLPTIPDVVPLDKDDRTTVLGKMLPKDNVNLCEIGKALKKPMAWVAGQYLKYVLRLRDDIQRQVDERVKGIFTDVPRRYSTIAVQFRSGKPDAARKVLPLDIYMEAVTVKARELELQGRPVSVVYLASQNNVEVFRNESYMQERFGGNYTYKMLSPITSGIDKSREIETELGSHPEISREPFMVELLADLKLMVEADVFIGSLSNIFDVVMLLRYANDPGLEKQYTCMINHQSKLLCENNDEKRVVYQLCEFFITGDDDAYRRMRNKETKYGAFEGGTPF